MSESFTCPFCEGTQFRTVLSGVRDWEFGVEGTYGYRQCEGCSHIHLSPFPDLDALKRAYPAEYSAHVDEAAERGWLYRTLYRVNMWLFRRRFRKLIAPESAVADIGCGNGEFLQSMRELGAGRIVGVDFNDEACAKARAKGVEAFCGLYVDYPARDEFDAVFMNNYLEHVLDPMAEVAKTFEVLRPGGVFSGELPNWDGWDRRVFGRYWGGNHVPRHTYQFTPRVLQQFLERAGFVDVRVYQEPNPSVLVISLQNWLQRDVADLADNPALRFGRMRGFALWMVLLAPLNLVAAFFDRSGIVKFEAVKATEG